MRPSRKLLIAIFVCTAFADMANGQEVTAYTEPYRSVDISAAEMGTLADLNVVEGQYVKSGEVIARLDDSLLKASLKIAECSATAQGRLNSALAELKMQKEKFEKLRGLRDRNHASQNEIDRATGQLEVAEARVESARDELRLKEREKARILVQLERMKMKTPIDGYVTHVSKESGEFISMYEPVVAHVVQLDPLLGIFSVPNGYVDRFQAGELTPIKLGADETEVQAYVEYVAPTADAQSGTVRVKVRIPNPGFQWRAGIACYLEVKGMKETKDADPADPGQPSTLPISDQVVGVQP